MPYCKNYFCITLQLTSKLYNHRILQTIFFWWLFLFTIWLDIQAIPPNNKCIINEEHIIKVSGIVSFVPEFSIVNLTNKPEDLTPQDVGYKYCGFRITNMDDTKCPANITVDFAAFDVAQWGSIDKSYCVIYTTFAECVCDFYQCNTLSGVFFESAMNSINLPTNASQLSPDQHDHQQPFNERNSVVTDCLQLIVESAYNVAVPSAMRLKTSKDLKVEHRAVYSELWPNDTEVQKLKELEKKQYPTTTTMPPHNGAAGGGSNNNTNNNNNNNNGGGNSTNGSSSSKSNDSSPNLALIIGLSVGGCLLLAVIAIIITIQVLKYRRRELERKQKQEAEEKSQELQNNVDTWLQELTKEDNFLEVVQAKYFDVRREFIANPIKSIGYNPDTHRYHDIPCIEETRVKTDDPNFFYHANDIILADGKRVIAAQGPMQQTAADFWKMIVFTGSDVILMLCQFIEENKEKCVQYFSLEPGAENAVTFGDYEVTTLSMTNMIGAYRFRDLEVKHPGGVHSVKHLEFYEWHDHARPEDVKLLSLMQHVRDMKPKLLTVHCSAGVGRTGTAIGVMEAEAMLQHERKVDLYEVLSRLRRRRNTMIQNEEQFAAVHMIFIDRLASMQLISRSSANYKKFIQENERYVELKKKEAAIKEKAIENMKKKKPGKMNVDGGQSKQ